MRRGVLRVDSLSTVAPPKKKKNPWTSPSEVLLWLLFVALIFPAVFVGYAVGHYTSLGKPPKTVISTTTIGSTMSTPTTTPETTTAATTTASTTTSSSGGDVAAGKVVFTSNCASCHTFAAAGASGTVGPDLDTAIATDAQADGNMDLDAFIKESITDPGKYIASGYSDGIMSPSYGSSLTSKQIDDLVAFISANTQQ